jgi:hypothetical protein
VLSAKWFFGRNPHVSAHFDKQRDRYIQSTDAMTLIFRDQFEQAFRELICKVNRGHLLSNNNVGTFLDIGFAPGGFSKFILDNNQGAVGLGVTLPGNAGIPVSIKGTFLEDKSRYRLELADITTVDLDSIRAMYPLPSGATADDGYDLVIAGAFPTGHPKKRATLALAQLYAILSNLRPGGSAVIVANTKLFLWIVEILAVLRRVFDGVEAAKGDKMHALRSSAYFVCTGFLSPMSGVEGVVDVSKLREQVAKALQYVKRYGHHDTDKEGEEAEDLTHSYDVEWYGEPVIFAPEGPDAFFDSEHQFVLDLMEPLWETQMDAMKKASSRKRGGSFGSFSQPSNSHGVRIPRYPRL